MNKTKKLIGSTLLGASVLGGIATVGAGVASAAPQPGQPGANQPVSNGANPNWRPGPVQHGGRQYQPIWDANKHHWGFWIGPVWIPIG